MLFMKCTLQKKTNELKLLYGKTNELGFFAKTLLKHQGFL